MYVCMYVCVCVCVCVCVYVCMYVCMSIYPSSISSVCVSLPLLHSRTLILSSNRIFSYLNFFLLTPHKSSTCSEYKKV